MRSALLVLLLLASCDDPQKAQQDSTALALQTGEQSAQIQQLQDRLDKLENKEASDKLELDVEQAGTSKSLESLTGTFNNDVKIDNDRAHGTFSMMQAMDDRLSRYDGQHSTR